jgi:hypothetical protein
LSCWKHIPIKETVSFFYIKMYLYLYGSYFLYNLLFYVSEEIPFSYWLFEHCRQSLRGRGCPRWALERCWRRQTLVYCSIYQRSFANFHQHFTNLTFGSLGSKIFRPTSIRFDKNWERALRSRTKKFVFFSQFSYQFRSDYNSYKAPNLTKQYKNFDLNVPLDFRP